MSKEDGTSTPHAEGQVVRPIGELVASAVFLLVAGTMVIMATGFGDEAKRLPLTVGIPLTVMALINFSRAAATWARPTPRASASVTEVRQERERPALNYDALSSFTVTWSLAGLVAAFFVLGILPASFLFVALFVWKIGRSSVITAVVIALVLSACLYTANRFAAVPIYEGILRISVM